MHDMNVGIEFNTDREQSEISFLREKVKELQAELKRKDEQMRIFERSLVESVIQIIKERKN